LTELFKKLDNGKKLPYKKIIEKYRMKKAIMM